MRFFSRWLKKYAEKKATKSYQELKLIFQHRYHNFKLLLSANNRSLEVMAEIEEMLTGHKVFDMAFIRSRMTKLSTSVFQMIQNLNEIGSYRYEKLFKRFYEIQSKIRNLIELRIDLKNEPLVVPIENLDKNLSYLAGSKMANLGEIRKHLNVNVPEGFVITSEAYWKFMLHNDLYSEINLVTQKISPEDLDEFFTLSSSIQKLIINAPIPCDLEEAICNEVFKLCKKYGENVTFILRSSAIGEDLVKHSFAGQYRSILNVSPENVLQAYKEVVASKYTLTAMNYRLRYGIRDEDVPMCVGCLIMVEPLSSGVIYTVNPINPKENSMLVHSLWGLPKPVVDGSLDADLFVLSRDSLEVISENLAIKDVAYVNLVEEGVTRVEVPPHQWDRPSLTREQLKTLGEIALKIEKHYGKPQDIEWALLEDGSFVILQTREILIEEEEKKEAEPKQESSYPEDRVLIKGGVTASPGCGYGKVFILRKDADMLRFPEGCVLVTELALPRWASLLNKASAVITEVGNVVGHLASVAREFGVPAIFGLKNATIVLKDGEEVTVYADKGVILKGKVEIATPSKEKALMIDTPIYKLLYDVSRYVVPLNLLDPDSVEFAPENCRTFHDITRFCHEMAVREMFKFGKEFSFPERFARQLIGKTKMQFWVLDLDDGFIPEAVTSNSKYIKIEEIQSIPMKAIWEGMVAIPWRGPPPVEAKGFLSVLMEATANPNLDPAVASDMMVKNYFMISKHFCILQSRFGFHFSTIETLVSERSRENYASFNFKGGAASFNRRVLRAKFICEILQLFDFRCNINGDALNARIEGRSIKEMEEILRILGYLTIHTRQLDMIMTNPDSVCYYRNKMLEDIKQVSNFENLCAKLG